MSYIPAKVIEISTINNPVEVAFWTYDDSTGDPWIGNAYRWTVELVINSPQTHSSHLTSTPFFYDGNDIRVGDWIATEGGGRTARIIAISSQNSGQVNCTIEDLDRVNAFQNPDQNGLGAVTFGSGYAFEVKDGYPILFPFPGSLIGGLPNYFASQLFSRFLFRKAQADVQVDQVAHGLSLNDAIYLDTDGLYKKAIATSSSTAEVIGYVSETTVPGPDKFRYKPVGPFVQVPMPSGSPGSVVYLSDSVAGGLTTTAPTIKKKLFIKISSTTGIFIGQSSEASSGTGSYPTRSNKEMVASTTTADGQLATVTTLVSTPVSNSYVKVEVNGLKAIIGDGVKTKACYFSSDGGTTARTYNGIVSGDSLYWNGSIAGFELDTNDRIDVEYSV
jgi:hypothetical protein